MKNNTSDEALYSDLARDQPKPFSHADLRSFTNDFDDKIGFGGFGDVYKGRFINGEQIAVKVLAKKSMAGRASFVDEVKTMGRAYHKHLVKLYGFCFESNMQALVYEYMENGSLDKILYEENHHSLEWEKLYVIAIKTAKVLSYLHDGCQVIHYDIKPANVLLDSNHSPKLADFGLAKLIDNDVTAATISGIRGTPGYTAPELAMNPFSPVSYSCDIYSYGMMLFEILGRRSNAQKNQKWFPTQVWEKFVNEKLDELLEDCGIRKNDRENAEILSKVALWCIQLTPERRYDMSLVASMLEKKVPVPKPPNPFPSQGTLNVPLMPPLPEVTPKVYSKISPAIGGSLHDKHVQERKVDSISSSSTGSRAPKNTAAELKRNSYEVSDRKLKASNQNGPKENFTKVSAYQHPPSSQSSESETVLGLFERRFPPNAKTAVIYYTDTSGGKLVVENCDNVRSILHAHQVKMDERDIAVNQNYEMELKKVLGREKSPPVLFVKGRYIGGSTAVQNAEREGKLRILFDGIPKEPKENFTQVPISQTQSRRRVKRTTPELNPSIPIEPREKFEFQNFIRGETGESESMLESFEKICPPGGQNSVILYTDTSGEKSVVKKCNKTRLILQSHQIKMFERDIWEPDYRRELNNVLGREKLPPVLFVKGRYIGGHGLVEHYENEGELSIILDGIRKEQRRDFNRRNIIESLESTPAIAESVRDTRFNQTEAYSTWKPRSSSTSRPSQKITTGYPVGGTVRGRLRARPLDGFQLYGRAEEATGKDELKRYIADFV